MVSKAKYIDSEFQAFERVCLGFEVCGFERPNPDKDENWKPLSGAYVSNIINEYSDQSQALRIIEYALEWNLASLRAMIADGGLTDDDLHRAGIKNDDASEYSR
jgi:hypothetical protein